MVNKILDDKIIKFLHDFVGGMMISIETGDSEIEFNRSYGKLRVNTSKGCIDIYNIEKQQELMGEDDDISGFECKINEEGDFTPYLEEKTETIQINEKISRISIIRDKIIVNQEIIVFDEAIIFEGVNTYMIARDWQYSELIYIYNHSNYDLVNPESKVVENWNNYGEYEVKVDRSIISF